MRYDNSKFDKAIYSTPTLETRKTVPTARLSRLKVVFSVKTSTSVSYQRKKKEKFISKQIFVLGDSHSGLPAQHLIMRNRKNQKKQYEQFPQPRQQQQLQQVNQTAQLPRQQIQYGFGQMAPINPNYLARRADGFLIREREERKKSLYDTWPKIFKELNNDGFDLNVKSLEDLIREEKITDSNILKKVNTNGMTIIHQIFRRKEISVEMMKFLQKNFNEDILGKILLHELDKSVKLISGEFPQHLLAQNMNASFQVFEYFIKEFCPKNDLEKVLTVKEKKQNRMNVLDVLCRGNKHQEIKLLVDLFPKLFKKQLFGLLETSYGNEEILEIILKFFSEDITKKQMKHLINELLTSTSDDFNKTMNCFDLYIKYAKKKVKQALIDLKIEQLYDKCEIGSRMGRKEVFLSHLLHVFSKDELKNVFLNDTFFKKIVPCDIYGDANFIDSLFKIFGKEFLKKKYNNETLFQITARGGNHSSQVETKLFELIEKNCSLEEQKEILLHRNKNGQTCLHLIAKNNYIVWGKPHKTKTLHILLENKILLENALFIKDSKGKIFIEEIFNMNNDVSQNDENIVLDILKYVINVTKKHVICNEKEDPLKKILNMIMNEEIELKLMKMGFYKCLNYFSDMDVKLSNYGLYHFFNGSTYSLSVVEKGRVIQRSGNGFGSCKSNEMFNSGRRVDNFYIENAGDDVFFGFSGQEWCTGDFVRCKDNSFRARSDGTIYFKNSQVNGGTNYGAGDVITMVTDFKKNILTMFKNGTPMVINPKSIKNHEVSLPKKIHITVNVLRGAKIYWFSKWSTKVHKHYPKIFKDRIKTILLMNNRLSSCFSKIPSDVLKFNLLPFVPIN